LRETRKGKKGSATVRKFDELDKKENPLEKNKSNVRPSSTSSRQGRLSELKLTRERNKMGPKAPTFLYFRTSNRTTKAISPNGTETHMLKEVDPVTLIRSAAERDRPAGEGCSDRET
jgi:hypothetical protein